MKKSDINNTEQVNEYMEKLDHPLKAEMEAVRAIIMNANEQIGEHIKWGAPSFFCKGGVDKGGMATFAPRAKKYVHVVFHNGIILNDTTGLLEGDYKDRRMAYFHNIEDVQAKKVALENAVNEWVGLMNE